MNKDRIEKLASTIEQASHLTNLYDSGMDTYVEDDSDYSCSPWSYHRPTHFNMRYLYASSVSEPDEDCDTVGCIAGWCVALWPEERRSESFIDAVARILDIPWQVADDLCVAAADERPPLSQIAPEQAAEAVRNLLHVEEDEPWKLWQHVRLDAGE